MRSAPRTVLMVFDARPQAARDARTATTRILDSWNLSHLTDTATLLVSELITNAIVHAHGSTDPPEDLFERRGKIRPVLLGMGVSLRESLWIEVWDPSTTPPRRHKAGGDEESGRGLELVNSLSKDWGWNVLTASGKVVWFTLSNGCV
jgi:hypothetical protein